MNKNQLLQDTTDYVYNYFVKINTSKFSSEQEKKEYFNQVQEKMLYTLDLIKNEQGLDKSLLRKFYDSLPYFKHCNEIELKDFYKKVIEYTETPSEINETCANEMLIYNLIFDMKKFREYPNEYIEDLPFLIKNFERYKKTCIEDIKSKANKKNIENPTFKNPNLLLSIYEDLIIFHRVNKNLENSMKNIEEMLEIFKPYFTSIKKDSDIFEPSIHKSIIVPCQTIALVERNNLENELKLYRETTNFFKFDEFNGKLKDSATYKDCLNMLETNNSTRKNINQKNVTSIGSNFDLHRTV